MRHPLLPTSVASSNISICISFSLVRYLVLLHHPIAFCNAILARLCSVEGGTTKQAIHGHVNASEHLWYSNSLECVSRPDRAFRMVASKQ